MQTVPMNKEFEEQFIQDARAFAEMNPSASQQHEDFNPYLSQYADYDSMLTESMSSVRDLGISQRYDMNDNSNSDFDNSNQMTITPASLAKFSKYLNAENLKAGNGSHQMLTPDPSPVKNQQQNENRATTPSTPSLSSTTSDGTNPYTTPSSSPEKMHQQHTLQRTHQNSNRLTVPNSGAFGHYDSESESGFYLSSPEAFSPGERSPELGPQALQSSPSQPVLAPNPNMTTTMDIYSSLDMSQFDPKTSQMINWQPVVTAPVKREAEEIIKMQRTTAKVSSRKSCLPPGKVDSYLVGPNEQGMFECLFPNCGKFFRRRYNVRSHIQTHLCDRPYSCDDCGACFVRPHDLRRHVKCHQSDRPFVCPCGKAFTRHDALQRHRIRMICPGGIEIPGRPKRVPAKRGRPRKNPRPNAESSAAESSGSFATSESESDQSPVSSPEMMNNQGSFSYGATAIGNVSGNGFMWR